ncbi:MAG: hypothetical protein ACRDJ4_16600 [Actinomycetota bacterium]
MRITLDLNAKTLRRGGIGAGVIAVVALSFYIGQRSLPGREPKTNATASPSSTIPLVRFHDTEGGIAISYPKGWKRLKPSTPQTRLLLEKGGSRIAVTVNELPGEIQPTEFVALGTPLRETIRRQGSLVTFICSDEERDAAGECKPKLIFANAVPGFSFLYTFVTADGTKEGIRSQYYLYHGAKQVRILFETVPVQDFKKVASTFDAVIDSFESTRRPGPTESAPPPSPSPS